MVRTEEDAPDEVIDLGDERIARLTASKASEGLESLLDRVALILTGTLELPEVLRRLADIALRETDARRCSVLLRQDGQLQPTVAIGSQTDPLLWEAFRAMEPIALALHPSTWRTLRKGDVITIEDARESKLIPPAWVEQFGLRAVALLPLTGTPDPWGLIALDYPEGRRFSAPELRLLGSLAACAGLAVRNARLYDDVRRRAQLQEALAQAAAALAQQQSAPEVAELVVRAYADLLGARMSGIGLFDASRKRITTIATSATRPRQTAIPFSTVPSEVLDQLTEAWLQDPRQIVTFGAHEWFTQILGQAAGDGAEHHIALPLVVEGVPRGTAILGFDQPSRLDREGRRAAMALADLAAATLERIRLHRRLDRQARHVQALLEANAAVTGEGADTEVVRNLDAIVKPLGLRIRALQLTDQGLRDALGLTSDAIAMPVDSGASTIVPVSLAGHRVGSMVVGPAVLEPADRAFLDALANGVAEVASRGAMHYQLDRAARERAITAERERIASDLHDTVGEALIAIGMISRRSSASLAADSPWAQEFARMASLAETSKWEIDQVLRAWASGPTADRRLPQALEELAGAFEADSGISVLVEISGPSDRLPAEIERGLYRVAHEALTNAWRHARCALARVTLEAVDETVRLTIRDDGRGLAGAAAPRHSGVGLIAMRRVVKDLGGRLRVEDAAPRGTVVRAEVPVRQ